MDVPGARMLDIRGPMSPFAVFNPATWGPADPGQLAGPGVDVLMDAARHFPGGPAVLVFALFWSPVGPGIPAGVLLARHIPLSPFLTFGLYALSDVLGAAVCHPLFTGLRRYGGRVPALRKLGNGFMKVAMFGTSIPHPQDCHDPARRGVAPALFRVGTVGFGVDVYTAGMVMGGLPVPRLLGWASAIAGDVLWFALLLATSIGTAAVVDDDRVIGIVVLVAMLVLPQIAKSLFPALRDPGTGTGRPDPA